MSQMTPHQWWAGQACPACGCPDKNVRATRYAAALLAFFLFGSIAGAQESPRTRPFGEGTHTFRAILNERKLEPIPSVQQFRKEVDEGDPSSMLVIVFGENREKQRESVLDRIPNGLADFLSNGGAVLVASDRELCDWHQRLAGGISVSGAFVQATQARSMYRDSADCPFVQPVPSKNIPIFDGLHKVATNRPSFLILGSARRLRPLAMFPEDCKLESIPADVMRLPGMNRLLFAAGGQVGDGRMLVLADHSVFINDMMLQTDNDNFDLACNAIEWLAEKTQDGKLKRDRVLFVDEGTVVANFNVILKEPPLPPLPPLPSDAALIALAQQRLGEMDRENLFNRLAVDALGGEQYARNRLILALIIAGTFALLVMAGLRLGRARQRIDLRLPVSGPELWQAPAATLPAQRQQALVQAGNFWEPARALARQFFERAADCRPDSWVSAGRRPPQLTIADASRRRRFEKDVRALWRLAASTTPYRVTAADFQRVVTLVPTLQPLVIGH